MSQPARPGSVLVVAGTRPEFIKLGPLVRELVARLGADRVGYVATGQHQDGLMADAIVGSHATWPAPHRRGAWPDARHLSPAMRAAAWADDVRAHRLLDPHDVVVVQGDTASALAGMELAERWGRPLVHVEAGLRCWDDRVPEEHIRRTIDRNADLLLAPSQLAAAFAQRDAHPAATIRITGQTGYDAFVEVASEVMAQPPVDWACTRYPWALFTAHRAEWPSYVAALQVARAIGLRLANAGVQLFWPLHPRWRNDATGEALGVAKYDPWTYAQTAYALSVHPPVAVFTDSGGLVEESYYAGVPCVVLRDTTERWEPVADGAAMLAGMRPDDRLALAVDWALGRQHHRVPGELWPYAYGAPGIDTQSASQLAANAIEEVVR